MLCEEVSIHDAFIGEPVEEVLEMVRWALSHEDEEGFDPAKVLTNWAKKRGRGAWSGRPHRSPTAPDNPNGGLAQALVKYWIRHPEELVAVLDQVEASINGRS